MGLLLQSPPPPLDPLPQNRPRLKRKAAILTLRKKKLCLLRRLPDQSRILESSVPRVEK